MQIVAEARLKHDSFLDYASRALIVFPGLVRTLLSGLQMFVLGRNGKVLGSFGPGRPKMDNRAVINVRFQSASAFCML